MLGVFWLPHVPWETWVLDLSATMRQTPVGQGCHRRASKHQTLQTSTLQAFDVPRSNFDLLRRPPPPYIGQIVSPSSFFAFSPPSALAAPCSCFASNGGRCWVSVSYGPSPTARLQSLVFVHRFQGRNRRAGPLEPGHRKVSKVKRPACKKLLVSNLATTRFRCNIVSFCRRL